MKKAIASTLAALLCSASLSQAQVAQETVPPADPSAVTAPSTPPPPPSDPNAAVPPVPVAPDPNMVPAASGVPENPAAMPGSAANPIVSGGNMTEPPAPMEHYPMCSKTVTDHCMQPADAPRGYARKKHK